MTPPNTAAVRSRPDVLPDYVLSEPPYLSHCDLEEEMNRRFWASYVDRHTRNDSKRFDVAAKEADDIIAARPFKTLGRAYKLALIEDHKLTPHLLVACLWRYHPGVTIAQARALLDADEDRLWTIRDACLDLVLGPPPKKADAVPASTAVTAST